MSVTILQRLEQLRRRRRGLLRLQGFGALALFLPLMLIAAGVSDFVFHLDDPGVRLIELIAIGGATVWILWSQLVRPLSKAPSDVQLSLEVERQFPEFRDLLSSAAQFEEGKFDPEIGSVELQRDLTERIENRLQSAPLEKILDFQPIRRRMTLAAMVCGLGLIVLLTAPQSSLLAMRRLATPFAELPWPRRFQLALVDRQLQPLLSEGGEKIRRVQGEGWELCIVNWNGTGELPPDLELLTRREAGGVVTREGVTRTARIGMTEKRSAEDSSFSREAGVVKLTLREPLQICAVGGDDRDEEWLQIETVPPPLIDEFQIEVQPPSYLNRPSEKLTSGQGKFEAYLGSSVRLTAKANRALKSCNLDVKGTIVAQGTSTEDPRTWTISWNLKDPGTFPWHWVLSDLEGFSQPTPPQFEVTVIADQPPEIRLEAPVADQHVTPHADLLFQVTAKDDLGLREVKLRAEIIRNSMAMSGEGKVTGNPEVIELPLELGGELPKSATLERRLSLKQYSLNSGDRITVTFQATDAFPGPPLHVTKSAPRQIFIVSPEEKLRELADAQSGLLNELERANNTQTETRNQVRDLQRQWEKAGSLRPQDRDLLQRTEMQQRQITSELNLPGSGIASRAEELIQQHKQNQLEDTESISKLQNLADELKSLGKEQLPRIEDALTQVRKNSGNSNPQQPASPLPPTETLKEAEENQTTVQGKLRELVQDLTEWRDQRYAARQVEEIIAQQEQTNRETAELSQRTLGKGMQELSNQDEADLARMAERQRQHAEKLEQLEQQLSDTLKKRETPDQAETPPAEGMSELKDFLEQAEKLGTLSLMRGASREINSNNLGEAGRTQQETVQQLQQLADILRNRQEQNTDKLVEQLQETQEQLKNLQQQQAELKDETGRLESMSDLVQKDQKFSEAAGKQEELQDAAERLARRMNRLQAESPGERMRDAAESMRQAEKSLGNQVAPNALEQQKQAEEAMKLAEKQLQQTQKQLEQRQAQEKVATVRDIWKQILTSQEQLLEQTKTLQQSYEEKKQWNRVQLRALSELATKQNQLVESSEKTSEFVAPAKILSLSLKRAIQSMIGARELLAERQTGSLTQESQAAARDRLRQILDAFEQQVRENDQNQSSQGGGQNGENQDQERDPFMVPPLAELKILRGLQQEINERTEQLSQALGKTPSNPKPLHQELQQLAGEQEQLLEIFTEALKELQEGGKQVPPEGPIPPRNDPIGNQPSAAVPVPTSQGIKGQT